MNRRQRPYFSYAVYDAKKWIPFLLIPAIRLLIFSDPPLRLTVSVLQDIGFSLLLLSYILWKWRQGSYTLYFKPDGVLGRLILQQGILLKRTVFLSISHAASLELECTPLLFMMRGRRVRVNTAGIRRRADATLYLSAAQVKEIFGSAFSRRGRDYAARIWPVTMLAASGSNAAIGLLTLAPALKQIGNVLNRPVQDEVVGWIGKVVTLGLPPLLETVANVLLIGWAFSFMRIFLRYAGFFTLREGNRLHIHSGLFTRRDVLIDCRKITALELRQTMLMRLFGLHSAVITAAGYGRDTDARPVLVPAARAAELCRALDRLLFDFPTCSSLLRPARRAWPRYLTLPLLILFLGFLPLLFGGSIGAIVALLWMAVCLWWLGIRYLGFRSAGFGVSRTAACVRYSRGLALYEVHIPIEVVDCVVVTRSPWQRRDGTCSVEVRTFGEKRRRHRVWALPYPPIERLLGRLTGIDEE